MGDHNQLWLVTTPTAWKNLHGVHIGVGVDTIMARSSGLGWDFLSILVPSRSGFFSVMGYYNL